MKSVKLNLPVLIVFFLVSFGLGAFSYWAGISLFSGNNYLASKDGKSAQSLTNYGQQAGNESNYDSADGRQSRIDEFGDKSDATEHVVEETHGNSIENPREAWHELVQQSRGSIGNVGALIDIANAWVQEDGLSVLQEINESNLLEQNLKWAVLGSIVHEAAERNPRETFEQTLSMGVHGRSNRFSMSAALVWAESDAMAALEAVTSVDDTFLRVYMQQEVLSDVAARDPRGLLANLDELPVNVQEIAKEHVVIGFAQNDPKEAVRMLQELGVGLEDNNVAVSIVDFWRQSDPLEAKNWVVNSPLLEGQRSYLAGRVIDGIASEQPELAMEMALEQPADWRLETYVISNLAYSDPFEAMALLPKIRDPHLDPNINSVYGRVGYGLIEQGHAESVAELATLVPEQQRNTFYTNLVSSWAGLDPLQLLSTIDELPSPAVRSSAAFSLVTHYDAVNSLTDDQIELAKTYLNEWDLQRLDKSQTHFRFLGSAQEMRFAGTPDQVRFLMDELEKLIEEVESDDPSD